MAKIKKNVKPQKTVKKTVKKAVTKRKTVATKTVSKTVLPASLEVSENLNKNVRFMKLSTNVFFVLIALGLLFAARKYFVAASVNGRYISRFTVISELEKQGGKQVLESLISKNLLFQEASKKGVKVSSDEIDAKINAIEAELKKQGQDLDTVLGYQGMTRASLTEQTKLQLILEKMLGDKTKVTDKEVAKYIAENQASLPTDKTEKELNTLVKEQLASQKLSTEAQKFLQELKASAKINYFQSY
jgi:parvulin-like peptidyl-prolyl isomerase